MIGSWPRRVDKLVEHLLLKGDRIKAVERNIYDLCGESSAKVWFVDYAMPVKLAGTFDETLADFLSNDQANNLEFLRMHWDDGALWKEYWDFVFTGSKDIQSSIQIQHPLLEEIAKERSAQGSPALQRVRIRAGDFKVRERVVVVAEGGARGCKFDPCGGEVSRC